MDLSKVLFVCTANTTDTIPGPLLDRMEVVRLPGYDVPEKVEIAQRYLVPKLEKASGLVQEDGSANNDLSVAIGTDALNKLIKQYAREARVNNNNNNNNNTTTTTKTTTTTTLLMVRLTLDAFCLCLQAGVRVLERKLETIFRKVLTSWCLKRQYLDSPYSSLSQPN